MQSVYKLLVAFSENPILPLPEQYSSGRKDLSISAHRGINYPSTSTNENHAKHESSDVKQRRRLIKGKRTLKHWKDGASAKKLVNPPSLDTHSTEISTGKVGKDENYRMELDKDVGG